jgi:starch synthase
MRIAHLSAEVSPYAKTGGLGDVVGALPVAQAEQHHDVAVYTPYYRQAREWLHKRGLHPEWVTEPIHLDLGYRHFECGVLRTFLPDSLVPAYFIANDALFDRKHIYDGFFGEDDGLIRYAVFVRAALALMKRLDKVPQILHAHDWHTALAPMALRWDDPQDWAFSHTATVLTVHNLAYQGIYSPSQFPTLGLPPRALGGTTWDGALNLMKGGLQAADLITGVSPTFVKEILSSDGGFGLDPLLRERQDRVAGILNGIDPHVWNPASDKKIPFNYSPQNLSGKLECRRALLALAGMDRDDRRMVVGVVSRLTRQKGLDLLFPVLPELLGDGIRVVFLGSGDDDLEAAARAWGKRAPGRFFSYVGFSDELAHLIEAGSDAFLMPSRFEPCGLSQLYSLAYGTIPIVRRTGGLADTVRGYDGQNAQQANGFTFDEPSASALRDTVRWAHRAYQDAQLWTRLLHNGMAEDHSWHRSAQRYIELYGRVLR